MRAVQLVHWQAEPELRDVAVPEPGAGEVLVEVGGAGLCHSDLHLMEWPEGTLSWRLPFTLGHETAGTVAALGPGASGVSVGDRVLIYGPWGCGSCIQCIRGADNLCPNRFARPGAGCGLGFDGGLADYVLVPSTRLLVPLGDLDLVEAAPLGDAALTPYHALKPELPRLVPGSSALVIGVGGLGSIAVQLLRTLSTARVVAVDLAERGRARALSFGAHAALDSRNLSAAETREALGGGASIVLDFVGSDQTLALAAETIELGGHIALVGIGGGTISTAFGRVPLEWSLRRPTWGTLPELHEVVALARSGTIRMPIERLALEDAIDGYHRLHAGDVEGRAVVVP
jgi:alcohol dehydrogenase, propanol-preferring